jgi:lipoprotein-anchoring transpeptidase ErfK/SrfK
VTARPVVVLVFGAAFLAGWSAPARIARASDAREAPPSALVPPWSEPHDIPLPAWARSVVVTRKEGSIFAEPGPLSAAQRRGSVVEGALLPLYGEKRAAGCSGRWWLVGPMAWICTDAGDLSAEPPPAPVRAERIFELPFRYYFAGVEGAYGYPDLERAVDDVADQELDPGFGVAVIEEVEAKGERWGKTSHGHWIALRELVAAKPSPFAGEAIAPSDAALQIGWVLSDRASSFGAPKGAGKPLATRARLDKVQWNEERKGADGVWVRVSPEGAPAEWMRAKDLTRPTVVAPPAEVASADEVGERWIDVDLATQTLVAYEGSHPVFATLVSTGIGRQGTDAATPIGVHRVWVKLTSTNMSNLQNEDVERHYSIEDVPYVQFFAGAVAIHGAFWHQGFGRVHSHGCVNVSVADASWLFSFTSPHLPSAWSAVLPSSVEAGTVVRVR